MKTVPSDGRGLLSAPVLPLCLYTRSIIEKDVFAACVLHPSCLVSNGAFVFLAAKKKAIKNIRSLLHITEDEKKEIDLFF